MDIKGGVKLKAEPVYLHIKLAFWPSGEGRGDNYGKIKACLKGAYAQPHHVIIQEKGA